MRTCPSGLRLIPYDSNKNEVIDSDEVLNAVEDYFNDVSGIDSDLVLDIVELYFSS